jgi:hypothetical protein
MVENCKYPQIRSNVQRGDKVMYERLVQYKGKEVVMATVVAVNGCYALLDNGDELFAGLPKPYTLKK